jgi:hypothetical protein
MSVPGNRLDFATGGPEHRGMDAGKSLMLVVAHPDDDAYGMSAPSRCTRATQGSTVRRLRHTLTGGRLVVDDQADRALDRE